MNDLDHARHHRNADIARFVMAASALIFAICFMVLVIWVTMAKQDSKLYEADNVVCVSQPMAVQCFQRKTAP